jgi:adenylyltransferase/sulfurtransferase
MAKSYMEIMDEARKLVPELSAQQVKDKVDQGQELALLDVREKEEFRAGHLDRAISLPRGFLEMQIEETIRDRTQPIVAYCAGGIRSLIAARTLREMGYENVSSMAGGFNGWKNAGLPFTQERVLTSEQLMRYARHFTLPEVGEKGQGKLLDAKVLCIGAGGLGSPTALYLAAAGVGTIGIVDHDVVDMSNLQRQILHTNDRVGEPKVDSAEKTIKALNPDVRVVKFQERLSSENVRLIFQDFDIIVNGCDNFPTRYLVNDACVFMKKPLVDGSIFQFEGQASVFMPHEGGPCYRCLFPEPPPPGAAPSCAEAGVLGVLPGLIGCVQAVEVIKLILDVGETLVGRMIHFDTLSMEVRNFKLRKDPECLVCSEHPEITDLIDYEEFCSFTPGGGASVGDSQEAHL